MKIVPNTNDGELLEASEALKPARVIQALQSIDDDLELIDAATNTQVKAIIKRLLTRQRAIIRYVAKR